MEYIKLIVSFIPLIPGTYKLYFSNGGENI